MTNELDRVVKELRHCGEALLSIAEVLADLSNPKEAQKPMEQPKSETTGAPPIQLETVRAVLAEKSRAGHTAEIRALLVKYGAEKLSEIHPSRYPALLQDAGVLGNG